MSNIYQWSRGTVPFICQGCGITIYLTPTAAEKRKFCTLQCFYKHHDYSGKNNAMTGRGYLIAGTKNGMYGKKHKQSTKDLMSASRTGRYALEKSWNWKGGKYLHKNRWVIYVDSKRIRQSRHVAEQCLGRKLLSILNYKMKLDKLYRCVIISI